MKRAGVFPFSFSFTNASFGTAPHGATVTMEDKLCGSADSQSWE